LPARGEVWLVELDPTRGHEQRGTRPALVVSTDQFNNGPAGLVVVAPMTTRDRNIPLRVPIDPPEGGVRERCFVMCEMARSVSTDRLIRQWGTVERATLAMVADRLRILLEL
jgi:mRNA interferase MazF